MKTFIKILLVVFLISLFISSFTQAFEGEKGDVNNDGSIHVLDKLGIANHILGTDTLDEQGLWRTDLNRAVVNCDGDGSANVLDMIKIADIILGSDACPTEFIDISGNWRFWIEVNGKTEDSLFVVITQSGTDLALVWYYSTGENWASGTLDSSDISFVGAIEYRDSTYFHGTVSDGGNIMSGTWTWSSNESGTWGGEKIDTIPVPWCVSLDYYRVYGSESYSFGPNFPDEYDNIWDIKESDWKFIGQENSTKEFEVHTSYAYVLITWSGKTTHCFDAITDEVAGVPFGLSGYTWNTRGLLDHDNFRGDPDGRYACTKYIGLSIMTFPGDGQSIMLDPQTGKGRIKIYMTDTGIDEEYFLTSVPQKYF